MEDMVVGVRANAESKFQSTPLFHIKDFQKYFLTPSDPLHRIPEFEYSQH